MDPRYERFVAALLPPARCVYAPLACCVIVLEWCEWLWWLE